MTFKKLILFISIISFQIVCHAQSREDLWKKDIEYLKTELAKKHKNLFHKTPQSVFNSKLDSISEIINKKTDTELYLALQEIVALMGDDHTSINNPNFNKLGVFPIRLNWFSDGIYVVNTAKKYSKLLNKKVIAFNNIPIEDVINITSKISSHENSAVKKSHFLAYGPSKIILEYYGIISSDSLFIAYEDHGKVKTIGIKSIAYSKEVKVNWTGYQPKKRALCDKNRRKIFWFEYNDTTKILYAQYNKCISKELYQKHGRRKAAKKLPSFNKFSKALIKQLESHDIEKFIFDMRYNPGGSSIQGTLLVKQIAKIESINQKGKLFVITGRRTFSSAVLNTLDFQNYTHAIFVGEPSGGKPNHFGEVKRFTLPNSGLRVNYSSKYFTHAKEDSDSFYPDKEIYISFEEYLNGIDPVMNWIINYKN